MSPDDGVPTFERAAAFDFERVKSIIERHFRVYELERDVRGYPGGEIAAFYVMGDPIKFEENFSAIRTAVREVDPNLVVILQHRLGEDVILVARRPPVAQKGHGLNIVLLVLTTITTTLAGSYFWTGYKQVDGLLTAFGADVSWFHPEMLLFGFISFSVPLMLILGIHETGHWWIARKHHVRTSLPFFIPVPPPLPFGTFGAFISMREPIPDRKALFDIGAAGPVAGFLVTIPVLVIGLALTAAIGQPIPAQPEVHESLLGPGGEVWGFEGNESGWNSGTDEFEDENRWVETIALNGTEAALGGQWRLDVHPVFLKGSAACIIFIEYLANATEATPPFEPGEDGAFGWRSEFELTESMIGTPQEVVFDIPQNATEIRATMAWDKPPANLVNLGDSLMFLGMNAVAGRLFGIPSDVLIHPTGVAGWVGLLVTGFNLLPAGQLDGGHIARALWGDRMRYASYAAVLLMFALSFVFQGWLLMAIIVLLLGVRHPPPLNDKTELDRRRKVVAALVGIILALTFVPIPLTPLV